MNEPNSHGESAASEPASEPGSVPGFPTDAGSGGYRSPYPYEPPPPFHPSQLDAIAASTSPQPADLGAGAGADAGADRAPGGAEGTSQEERLERLAYLERREREWQEAERLAANGGPSQGPRAGVVVWGTLVLMAGLWMLSMAVGWHGDPQVIAITLLAAAGAALLLTAVVSASRSARRARRRVSSL